MGLDTVELVLRCEEVFAIDLPDWKCERVRTVGDLYTILCEGLALTPVANPRPGTGTGHARISRAVHNPIPIIWTPEDVWATLVYVVSDQLQVDQAEVVYDASFQNDLGCD
jgi:acyl carrier protein